MRIAMLCVHSSPLANLGGKEAGGMNVYVRELARELGRRGIFVDIFTRSQDPSLPQIIQADRNVRVIHLHAGPSAPYDKNWLLTYLPEFVNRVRCFADSEDMSYDVIHSHYWLSGEVGIALRRAWRVPLVHMFHTLGALKNQIARGAEEQETLQRIEIERRLMREADAIIAATPLDHAQMVWHYGAEPARIRVVPCGVDLRRFQPRNSDTAREALQLPASPHKIVLLVGRIEPLKGIDSLIEATAILFERHPGWRGNLTALVVGGASDTEEAQWNTEQRRLDALRHERGVASAVVFAGAKPQEQLALYYNAADIVTMPSHYESFGMAALEGLASGRPVVATNTGGPALIVEDGISGLHVTPAQPAELADRLDALLTDDAMRQRTSRAARERALRYGWPTIACDILEVYRDTLGLQRVRAKVS
jgi:D-inositol-3-phosphate glycosyltransferase